MIAELLGVPENDHHVFMEAIEAGPPPGSLNSDDLIAQNQPLVLMGMYFAGYVSDRRETPSDDVLSELANAVFPDGWKPADRSGRPRRDPAALPSSDDAGRRSRS